MWRYLLIFTFIVILVGCSIKPDTCKEQSAWQMGLTFKQVVIKNNVRSVKDSTLKSFYAVCTNKTDTGGFKTPSLALAQTSDTTSFRITLNGKANATMYVIYKRDRIFENYKCGFRTNFILDTVYTSPVIYDSIIIVQPNITDVNQENCRFYLSNAKSN